MYSIKKMIKYTIHLKNKNKYNNTPKLSQNFGVDNEHDTSKPFLVHNHKDTYNLYTKNQQNPKSVIKSEKLTKNITDAYKKRAKSYTTLLMPVSILNRTHLSEGIPMHITVKMFTNQNGETPDISEIEKRISSHEHKLTQPIDIKKLSFTPGELKNREGDTFKVLFLHGLPQHFKDFYDANRDVGTTYDHFKAHITVPEDLWHQIKNNNLTPEKSNLIIDRPHLMQAGMLIRKL